MSFNRNIEATELEPKTKIENATVHTSTVSQLKVKHKKVKIDRIYPPLRSKNLETLFTIVSAPASTFFWDPTKPNFFALIVFHEPTHCRTKFERKYIHLKKNVSYAFQKTRGVKDITFARLHLIKSMRNVRTYILCLYDYL